MAVFIPDSLGMGRVRHIHFVGIGGMGMSGIAEVMNNLGYTISGSDVRKSPIIDRLCSLGVKIVYGHAADNISGSDVLVYSSAIDKDNPELRAAEKQRIPIVKRAEMLAELMRFSEGIAIAGTHGKTTTTSLVANLFAEEGLDPTYVIGGLINSAGSHAKLGKGKYFIAEADESDTSFLHLTPIISVITNIDLDHLGAYQGKYQNLCDHFIRFIHRLPFYGLVIMCTDNKSNKEILPKISRHVITYGSDKSADYRAELYHQDKLLTRFRVSKRTQQDWLDVSLNMPGRHNMLNALAAIVVAHELGIPGQNIVKTLSRFRGLARRCQHRGDIVINGKRSVLIDDYAHHPVEIEETIRAIKGGWPNRRLVVIYQPHRFTRLQDLFEDFCRVLSGVDALFLLNVYAASERPIANIDSHALCRSIAACSLVKPVLVEDNDAIFDLLADAIEDGDLLLTLGAGDIDALSKKIYQQFAKEDDT